MGNRHLTVAALLASVLAAGLVTGCAQGSGKPSAGGSPSPSSASPASSADAGASAAPSGSPSAGASGATGGSNGGGSTGGGSNGDLTVSGEVTAGTEPSCMILRSNGGTYQLVGGDKSIVKPGNNVTVTGHLLTGMMSYCMQGRMFQVTQAHLN